MDYKTSNNVEYDYSVVREGGRFVIFKNGHTKKEIAEAKKELRKNHDVVSIHVVKRKYIAYLRNFEGDLIDQTSIDEDSKELARDIFREDGYDIDGEHLSIDIEAVY